MSQRLKLSDSQGKIYVAYKVSGQRYEMSDARWDRQIDLDEAGPRYELHDVRSLRHDADTMILKGSTRCRDLHNFS